MERTHNCDKSPVRATCTDTVGSYTCSCNVGWVGNGSPNCAGNFHYFIIDQRVFWVEYILSTSCFFSCVKNNNLGRIYTFISCFYSSK